ncbi:MFS transporter [Pseudomonas lini]
MLGGFVRVLRFRRLCDVRSLFFFQVVFFPQDSALAASLNVLGIFAIGFLARPVGAMLAGRLADRFGRKPIMLCALMLATLGSLVIACAPTYGSIGATAAFVLVAARLMQGLAHGMESISAFVYVGEMADPKWRTLQSCAYPIGLILGIIQGTLFGAILSSVLSAEDMQGWGWRIPFAIGVLYGLFDGIPAPRNGRIVHLRGCQAPGESRG